MFSQSLAIAVPKMSLVVLAPAAYAYAAAPPAAPPTALRLSAPWPNPSPGATWIAFELPRATRGELAVYDLAGRVTATLASGDLAAGAHSVRWSGEGTDGRPAAPGLYFVRLRTGFGNATVRLAIAR